MVVSAPHVTVSQSDVIALLSAIYSVASIVVVFQMFALQSWFEKVQNLDDLSFNLEQTTIIGALERIELMYRIKSHRRALPVIQLAGLSSALVLVSILAAALAPRIKELSLIFTLGPLAIFLFTFAGTTLGTIAKGRSTLGRAVSRLE